MLHLVKSTREGLVGQRTASGYVIDTVVPFVALPSHTALFQHVVIRNPKNKKSCVAVVLDIGPWNIDDNSYVFGEERPAAERGISLSGKGTNGAGIDLSEAVWHNLEMTGNDPVEWQFLTLDQCGLEPAK